MKMLPAFAVAARASLLLPLLGACATTMRSGSQYAPLIDYHQHLVSPAFAPIVKLPERDGRALLSELDAAGIGKGVVLSVAYSFADERKKLDFGMALNRRSTVLLLPLFRLEFLEPVVDNY